MGKPSSVDAGTKYFVVWHVMLGKRMDAVLALRAGDKSAWSGWVSASTTVSINRPQLFGGDTDQGGMVGTLAIMMGEADQQPNAYLTSIFGPRVVAWRGFTGLAWQGGEYGSNNPYPFKMSAKTFSCYQIWDEPDGWYPETAAIITAEGTAGSEALNFSYEGGQNFPTEIAVDFGPYLGEVTLDYITGTNPDKFVVEIDGVEVLNTGYVGDPDDISGGLTFQQKLDADLTSRGLPTEEIVLFNTAWAGTTDLDTDPGVMHASFAKVTPASTGTLKVYGPLSGTGWAARLNVPGFSGEAAAYAMNPVHIIVHAHTHSEMAGNPLETINDASARAAADWYYAQGFGINVRQRVAQESPSDVIKRVERVAGLSFTRNMATGLWEFYVANGEYDLDSLPILTDDDIISFKETPTVLDNAVNSVQVKYFDPERKESVITPPLRALGLVDLYGEIQQVFDFPEIPTGSIAGRVGWREALNYGTPSRRFDLVAKPTGAAYDLNRGQYFRLQLPKRGITDMVCTVGDKKEGTLRSGAIELAVVQDVFSFPDTVYSDVEHGIDARPSQVPVAIAAQVAFEAPYLDVCTRLPRAELEALPADVGFLAAAAADPARSRDFTLLVAPSGGEYVEGGLGDFCPSATVVEAGRRDGTQRDFTLANAQGLASVEVGDPVIWGSEWCRVDALDAAALTITMGRSCADTTPQEHTAGERLYFYRDGAAYDPTERVDGEADDVKLLTNTGSDRLDAAYAIPLAITFASRQSRPYPPAQLRINTLPAPAYLYGALTVEWVHRDRLLQADQLVDTEEAGIGPEAGTTYTVRTYVDGVLDDTQTAISGTSATVNPSASGNVRIEVEAERGGAASWQAQVREFAYTLTAAEPFELQDGTVLQTQTGDTIYLQG